VTVGVTPSRGAAFWAFLWISEIEDDVRHAATRALVG